VAVLQGQLVVLVDAGRRIDEQGQQEGVKHLSGFDAEVPAHGQSVERGIVSDEDAVQAQRHLDGLAVAGVQHPGLIAASEADDPHLEAGHERVQRVRATGLHVDPE
jgi:hypothetical protein